MTRLSFRAKTGHNSTDKFKRKSVPFVGRWGSRTKRMEKQ
jgi:hypothetical protein